MKKTLVAFVLLAVFLAYCSIPQRIKSPSTPTPTFHNWSTFIPGSFNTPAGATLSPDEVHQAVLVAWKSVEKAPPHHFESYTVKNEKLILDGWADVVASNYHQILFKENGNIFSEFYQIDNYSYSLDNGKWLRLHTSQLSPFLMSSDLAQVMDTNVYQNDGQVLGKEIINGKVIIIYTYTTIFKSFNRINQTRLWVEQSSGLPIRVEKRNELGYLQFMTITYDENLRIILLDEIKNTPY